MFIVLEMDSHFTWGIDWFQYVKGVRLGFLAIHIVFCPLKDYLDYLEARQSKAFM